MEKYQPYFIRGCDIKDPESFPARFARRDVGEHAVVIGGFGIKCTKRIRRASRAGMCENTWFSRGL